MEYILVINQIVNNKIHLKFMINEKININFHFFPMITIQYLQFTY